MLLKAADSVLDPTLHASERRRRQIGVLLVFVTVLSARGLVRLLCNSTAPLISALVGVMVAVIGTILVRKVLFSRRAIDSWAPLAAFPSALASLLLLPHRVYIDITSRPHFWMYIIVAFAATVLFASTSKRSKKAITSTNKQFDGYLDPLNVAEKELKLLTSAFTHWKIRPPENDVKQFTYHKNAMLQYVLLAVTFTSPIEILGLHLLIMRFNHVIAWIFTDLGALSTLYLFAAAKSLWVLPTELDNQRLTIRLGVLREVSIDMSDVASVKTLSVQSIDKPESLRLWALDPPNVRIEFTRPMVKASSSTRQFTSVEFRLDEPAQFTDAANIPLNDTKPRDAT